jgi:hypothetical protein
MFLGEDEEEGQEDEVEVDDDDDIEASHVEEEFKKEINIQQNSWPSSQSNQVSRGPS